MNTQIYPSAQTLIEYHLRNSRFSSLSDSHSLKGLKDAHLFSIINLHHRADDPSDRSQSCVTQIHPLNKNTKHDNVGPGEKGIK